jgi:50S ribosomal protein L16 3-hydroxylase
MNVKRPAPTALPSTIAPNKKLALLGGISPAQFMQEYWQKKPLLIRGAITGFTPLLTHEELHALAADEAVESRLLQQNGKSWELSHGPTPHLPNLAQKNWTVLLQGMEVHSPAMRALLDQFRFLPDARLDDVMISLAAEGGGVGPHFDSYDVFLLQAAGRRRWQISAQSDLRLKPNLPLKILKKFVPEEEFVLEAGDMLYLPPSYAHDGVALDAGCQTYSIGFYAPKQNELAACLLQRLAEIASDELEEHQDLYRDPQQAATAQPAEIPADLAAFARQGLEKLLAQPALLDEMLGEFLSEPKASVSFAPAGRAPKNWQHFVLAAGTRMLFDDKTIYCNGESWHVAGKDAKVLRLLANQRHLARADIESASAEVQSLLHDWIGQGWAQLRA